MRTKREISEAYRHILEGLRGCPPQERNSLEFEMGCNTLEVLAWVLKREGGEQFGELIARMDLIEALSAAEKGQIQ